MADLVYPRAIVQYISSHGKRPPNTPRLMICHTNAGTSSADGLTLWRYIINQLSAGNGAVTQPFAHVELDGDCWQFLDSDEKGVASYKAEGICLSIETQDLGTNAGPIGSQPWTPKQVETLADMFAWGHRQGWWPLQFAKVPIPKTYAEGGLGWHSMWGINTVAEPLINPWTTQKGKTCPASARIAQMPQILERAIAIVNPPPWPDPIPTPPDNTPKDDDMVRLIQIPQGIFATNDMVIYRAVSPGDITWMAQNGIVETVGPNAKTYTGSNDMVNRMYDVSPGAVVGRINYLVDAIIARIPAGSSGITPADINAIVAGVLAGLPKSGSWSVS